jgi:hypothetical protein
MSRATLRAFAILSILALAACGGGEEVGGAAESSSGLTGLPISVATQGASYSVDCRFKAVELPGKGVVNAAQYEGSDAWTTNAPGDNARCKLTKTAGEGPVTISIVKGETRTATAEAAGETVNLQVF